jgi:hypothetical protein
MKSAHSYLKDESGVSVVFFAAFLPVIFGFAAFGVDGAKGLNTKNFLERRAKITCDLIRSSNSTTLSTLQSLANDSFNASLPEMKLSPAIASIQLIKTGTSDYLINNEARIPVTFGSFVNYPEFTIRASFQCDKEAVTASACPNEIFFESFETPVLTTDWEYLDIPGWMQTGARLPEIQAASSVPDLPQYTNMGKVHHGNQFLEVDSDDNTSISKEFNLVSGTYQIRFFYRPELWHNLDMNSHNVSVCVESISSPVCTNVFDTHIDTTNPITGNVEWIERVKNFQIVHTGTYRLTLRATGISDGHGGHVDSLRILSCL